MTALVAHRVSKTAPDTAKMDGKRELIVALAWRKPSIVRIAHDSGDGETIFHCPFCGSGQVLARSDGTVDCEFCHTAFTVQVQPEMPAFPQTINGMPFQVPGMPMGGDQANVPAESSMAGGDPMVGDQVDPASGEGQGPEEGDPEPDDTAEGGPPDFLKNSFLRTHDDREVPADVYMRYLAVRHAHNPRVAVDKMRKVR